MSTPAEAMDQSRHLILKSFQSPGDVLMLTAVVRDLHAAFPGRYKTDVRTSADALWKNNPYLNSLDETNQDVRVIDMHYPLIQYSNQRPYHFIHGYAQFLESTLGVQIPVTAFRGDIHLSAGERKPDPRWSQWGVPENFWIIVAGGKYDFTAKWWNPSCYQQVVDHFQGRICFVQCGERGHWHPKLDGTVGLIGKTSLREFIHLMHHAEGVVCPVTLAMHLAAAVETRDDNPPNRAAIVIAGGREPPHWEAYSHHQFISTNGALSCCADGGCWRSRCQIVGDGDVKDRRELCEQPVDVSEDLRIARCMDMITSEDVIRRIEFYFEGGMRRYANDRSMDVVQQPRHSVNLRAESSGRPGSIKRGVGERPRIHRASMSRIKAVERTSDRHAVLNHPATPSKAFGRRRSSLPRVRRMHSEKIVHRRARPRPHNGAPLKSHDSPPPDSGASARTTQPAERTPQPIEDRSRQTKVLIKFSHGLGDAVQFGIVLRHLQAQRPDWEVDVWSLRGKHSAFHGLCNDSFHDQELPPDASQYERTINVGWQEQNEPHGNVPSTKVTRALIEEFNLTPDPSLFRYEINIEKPITRKVRKYLTDLTGMGIPSCDRFPILLLHYEGNTAQEEKNLSHATAYGICQRAIAAGLIPLILDWDDRSPLADGKTIFRIDVGSGDIWGNFGTGDAGVLAALIEQCQLMIGIDSGPLHVAGATRTQTIAIWTGHFPGQFFDLADNVLHFVPRNWRSLGLAWHSGAADFFEVHYESTTYGHLLDDLMLELTSRLRKLKRCGEESEQQEATLRPVTVSSDDFSQAVEMFRGSLPADFHPGGWHNNTVQEVHRFLAREAIEQTPPYPEQVVDRGIVICAGGARMFTNAWVCLRMLRHWGCTLPVQLWHLGEVEMDDFMRALVADHGAECVDAEQVRQKHPVRALGGWELKPYSILHCPFREVILLDADNVPLLDPAVLFDTPEYAQHGALFWPDYGRMEAFPTIWEACEVEYRDEPEFESGQIVVDKQRCWEALNLAMHYNEHSDYYFRHMLGDKETFHMAFRRVGKSYAMPPTPIENLDDKVMCQHDFGGRRIFQHRNQDKWRLNGSNFQIEGFQHEGACLQFLMELEAKWNGRPHWIDNPSPRDRRIMDAVGNRVYTYERVGIDQRSLELRSDRTIGHGRADNEFAWTVTMLGGEQCMAIFGKEGITCLLRLIDRIWQGRWIQHERMPIRLYEAVP